MVGAYVQMPGHVLHQDAAAGNLLYIGKAQSGHSTHNATLHEVRIYGVALKAGQVAAIRRNALPGVPDTETDGMPVNPVNEAATETRLAAGAQASELVHVPDIAEETVVGHLPHLPTTVPGMYRHSDRGPSLRVIWPAPENNEHVLRAGSYIVTGRVPGTSFRPRATVTVKPRPEATDLPARSVTSFPLGQVVLNPDRRAGP